MKDKTNLCWLDMEMTGLDPNNDKIIEIAMVITDKDLNILAQSESFAIHQSDDILNAMDKWNTDTHTRTGLINRVKTSCYNEKEVENQLLAFMQMWLPAQISPMCGNTIHQDRRFMVRYMPNLEKYFHYRNLDVSTIKELAKRWNPAIYRGAIKKGAHTALSDILESIEELKYYRTHFLKTDN